jgi:hypothetical protein
MRELDGGHWDAFTAQLHAFDERLEQRKSELAVKVVKQLDDFR